MKINEKIFMPTIGIIAGIISGLLGAGGGIIVVPALMKLGLKQKYAHAASVCIMLPICIVGSMMYIKSGAISFEKATPYIPSGIVGAIFGTAVLSKINPNILRKIFGCFSIWAAFRLLTR